MLCRRVLALLACSFAVSSSNCFMCFPRMLRDVGPQASGDSEFPTHPRTVGSVRQTSPGSAAQQDRPCHACKMCALIPFGFTVPWSWGRSSAVEQGTFNPLVQGSNPCGPTFAPGFPSSPEPV